MQYISLNHPKVTPMHIAVVFLLTILSFSTNSQIPFFQSYHLQKKTDDIQIHALHQDRIGFLWIGTSQGLFRFDGRNKIRYGKAQNFPNEHITAIAEDSLGRIWVGDVEGKLSYLEKNKVHVFEPAEGNATKAISDILFDKQGRLWFSTLNDGLYYFINDRLYRVDEQEGLPDLYIYDLNEDAFGNIWVGSDGGLAICALKENTLTVRKWNNENGLPDNIVKKIITEDKNVWLATEDAGIIHFDSKSGRFEPLILEWNYGTVNDFLVKEDKLWIACPQQGLVSYDRKSRESILYTPTLNQNLSSIQVLEEDIEGNIWAGSKNGLLRTPGDFIQFLKNPINNTNTNIIALTIDNQNNFWLSTSDGLFQTTKNVGSNDKSVKDILKNTPYQNLKVISLYTDYEGYVWAGLFGEGVLRINPITGKITSFNKELANGNVLSISGYQNKIWLATLGGYSQILIKGTNLFEIKNYSKAEGFSSNFNYQVYPDSNRLWFATDGKGLGLFDGSNYYQYNKGLPSDVIYGITKTPDNKIWVNVQNKGIYWFDNKQFHPLDSSLMIRNNNIQILTTDKSGNLVVLHDDGMDIIDVVNNQIRYYGEEIGMTNKAANLNAVGKDQEGNIYLGTTQGIIKYTSVGKYLSNKPNPKIESIKVLGEVMNEKEIASLAYNENNITIQFVGLWYHNAQGLFYKYKLENFDANWIETNNNSVTYSRLPAGKYIFRVMVSETEHFNRAQETAIPFSINYPFWQTFPFYVIVTLVVIMLGYFFIKFSERSLIRKNQLLEATVQQRTIEIQRQKDEIEEQHKAISLQAEEIQTYNENLENIVQKRTAELERKNKAMEEYAFINAHKLRSPVASILGLINLLSRTQLSEEAKEINDRLNSSVENLDEVVKSISRTIERGETTFPDIDNTTDLK